MPSKQQVGAKGKGLQSSAIIVTGLATTMRGKASAATRILMLQVLLCFTVTEKAPTHPN